MAQKNPFLKAVVKICIKVRENVFFFFFCQAGSNGKHISTPYKSNAFEKSLISEANVLSSTQNYFFFFVCWV